MIRRVQIIFSLGCFFLALHMGITQVVRFIQNKDTSVVSQKMFNSAKDDKYPTFSICFNGKEIYWRDEHILVEMTGMTSLQYVDFLEGQGWRYKYNETTRLYTKDYFNESKAMLFDIPHYA